MWVACIWKLQREVWDYPDDLDRLTLSLLVMACGDQSIHLEVMLRSFPGVIHPDHVRFL